MSFPTEAQTFGDVLRLQAARRGDKPAFELLDGRQVTFGQINRRVNRLNHAMAALGLRPGARAAIVSRNRPEYLEIHGLAKSGVIAVPINTRLTPAERSRLLAHCDPQVVFVDSDHADSIVDATPWTSGAPHVVAFDGVEAGRPGWWDYEALLASAIDDEPAFEARPHEPLCLIYTSGTTGAPKGVVLTHAGALGNSRISGAESLALTAEDRTLAVMPLFHVGGMWYHLFPSFATGCTTVLMPAFDAGQVLQALQRQRITHVHLVPTMVSALLAHPATATADLGGLRRIFYAASPMPVQLLRRAMAAFPACEFAQGYGSTEAGVISGLSPQDHRRAREPGGERLLPSCGKPFTGRELRLLDAQGEPVLAGEIGEIVVRSPHVMQGYWGDVAATRAALDDGWLYTGDLGRCDAEGYLYLVDRKNDMIVTGGENVFPTEVEACLHLDPCVLEAAVFGVPDPRWVERVVAAVVRQPGDATPEEAILARLRERLAAYKVPKQIEFTAELPRSGAGKLLRKELAQQWQARAEARP